MTLNLVVYFLRSGIRYLSVTSYLSHCRYFCKSIQRETKYSIGNREYQVMTSTLGNRLADHARKDFAMEDI